MRVGLDLQADGIPFPQLCDLRVDGFEKTARFLFFQVQVAVPRDAKRRRS
jgi:hypothetical protein